MSGIPLDLYEKVHELALAITNASEAGDNVVYDSMCLSLRALYDEQASLGRSHPFLTETVADCTDDAAEAARLYELALMQAGAYPHEPTHTKMISLAQQLIELGDRERAEAYLRTDELRLWVGAMRFGFAKQTVCRGGCL